jgi:hypothetical protein
VRWLMLLLLILGAVFVGALTVITICAAVIVLGRPAIADDPSEARTECLADPDDHLSTS